MSPWPVDEPSGRGPPAAPGHADLVGVAGTRQVDLGHRLLTGQGLMRSSQLA